jgi:urease accessory protein
LLRDLSPAGAPARGPSSLPAYVRAAGAVRVRFNAAPRGTEAAELSETGGFRVRFPKVGTCEAVIINTGGGMTGGDRLAVDLALDPGADATVTSQSAEKVYRSDGPMARVAVKATLSERASLAWLPQETILFSGARLARTLDVAMPEDASVTMAESIIFGRVAMGETMGEGALSDRWRVRRGGRLLFAENLDLSGPIAGLLARPAIGGGARAVATVLHVSPGASALLEPVREALGSVGVDAGASAWNGMLVVRLADTDPARLRAALARALRPLRPGPLPRVWQC